MEDLYFALYCMLGAIIVNALVSLALVWELGKLKVAK